jgi:choline dehydrogenase-like flavoprotein
VTDRFDVVVVGSGPSGSLAASRLVESGARVLMIDVAHDDEQYRQLIPDVPFAELRRSDPQQRRYFLGDQYEGIPRHGVRVGAQLTTPRQFVIRDSQRYLPVSGADFEPMQSLALGGLGATWGSACFTYTRAELEKLGIYEAGFERQYDEVAERIGVSGEPGDDASRHCFAGVARSLPPLEIDSVARCIWDAYQKGRAGFLQRGLSLGRTPLAVLSRDLGERRANPYFDMDFWGDSRRSVFRPRYLVEELEKRPGFQLVRGQLVLGFQSEPEGVRIHCLELASGGQTAFRARRLMLCAGAINSARIVLGSLGLSEVRVPILCNPYLYLPCTAMRMLGREAAQRRHSLSQLVAIYAPSDAPEDVLAAQIYSYRSLLLFKLVKEIPLPPWAGLQIARLLMSSLAIVGIHHSDAPGSNKTMRIVPRAGSDLPVVHFEYSPSREESGRQRRRERELGRQLRRLGLVPYSRLLPGHASSIHYAGTLPIRPEPDLPYATRSDGRLWAAPHVYVGDSSSWRFLPAKGLCFTIMAGARRVAGHLLRDLGSLG